MATRRKFLAGSVSAVAGVLATSTSARSSTEVESSVSETTSLCGEWFFRADPDNAGVQQKWYDGHALGEGRRIVSVPHTWQVEAPLVDYRGVAWYWRSFELPATGTPESRRDCAVRVEFEAVFHTATVWVNGQPAGEHVRKGYTAFTLDISNLLKWGQTNTIAVRVDNAFDQHMVPRGRSSDWANDGGIFRPVQLLIAPKIFVERVDVEAVPDLASGDGELTITAHIRNTSGESWRGQASFRVAEEEEPLTVLTGSPSKASVKPGTVQTLTLQATLPKAKLWHFDHPHRYRLEFSISDGRHEHRFSTNFGVRKLGIRDGSFHLNGERVRLMGVERMAGSNPEFGMAEPAEWISRDHADMKHLNCIFSRVHWPQDKRVLDYCDRHGILIQTEVPAWGPDTFAGMSTEPDADVLENALEAPRDDCS